VLDLEFLEAIDQPPKRGYGVQADLRVVARGRLSGLHSFVHGVSLG
jgi:hypothetical protein